jgi:SAM-dependent methyltransferase
VELLIVVAILVLFFGGIVAIGAPYVPSHNSDVAIAFDTLYPLGKKDTVVDIGSGDGRVLRAASSRGAKAVGFELNPLLWLISRLLSLRDPRVSVQLRDAWTTAFPDETTLVYAFAVQRDGRKLVRTVQRESNRLERSLVLLCYGSPLKGLTPHSEKGAHYRYLIKPLK